MTSRTSRPACPMALALLWFGATDAPAEEPPDFAEPGLYLVAQVGGAFFRNNIYIDDASDGLQPFYIDDVDELQDLSSFGSEDTWLKLNWDTGAAVTAFPEALAPKDLVPTGKQYKTAGGQLVEDKGGLRITAEDEGGQMSTLFVFVLVALL